jgi:hypothetical protein
MYDIGNEYNGGGGEWCGRAYGVEIGWQVHYEMLTVCRKSCGLCAANSSDGSVGEQILPLPVHVVEAASTGGAGGPGLGGLLQPLMQPQPSLQPRLADEEPLDLGAHLLVGVSSVAVLLGLYVFFSCRSKYQWQRQGYSKIPGDQGGIFPGVMGSELANSYAQWRARRQRMHSVHQREKKHQHMLDRHYGRLRGDARRSAEIGPM